MTARRPTALVTGGSIAGPAQAWALTRAGYDVTLLERAAQPREAGQNVDVRDAGHDVLRAMGLHDAVAASTTGEVGMRYYGQDAQGRTTAYAEMPLRPGRDGASAELEILRGRLSELLVGLTTDRAEHRYGTHVTAVEQHPDRVHVRFADGTEEDHDVLVVAEGRRSATRDLVLGDRVRVERRDLYIAYGTIERTDDDDDWWRWLTASDSRMVGLRPDNLGTIRANLGFVAPDLGLERLDHASLMRVLRTRFAGVGWHTERILDGFEAAPDELYLERTDRVVLPAYSQGRVIVVGDAAWAGGPTGMGTTLALVGAHVLGGELAAAGHDHVRAFAAYERLMRPYAEKVQTVPGSARMVMPRTARGLRRLRAFHKVLAVPAVRDRVEHAMLSRAGKDVVLPDYPVLTPAPTLREEAAVGAGEQG